jgi:hypothetical protein
MPFVLSWYHDLTCSYIPSYLYLPDRLSTLPDSARSLLLSRYLAALLHCVSFVLTFLFSLAFSRFHCLPRWSHLSVFLTRVSHYCSYLLILFCYLLSTILRISQLVTKLLIHLLTVLWLVHFLYVFKTLVKDPVSSDLVSFVIPGP